MFKYKVAFVLWYLKYTIQQNHITRSILSIMDLRQKIIEELHKPARRNFPRRNVVLKGVNDLYQADLVDVIAYSRYNKNYKYILTIIDCFTKVAEAIPLKDKTAKSIENAMRTFIEKNKIKMRHLQTDDGKEFFNSKFKELMKIYNINHYSTKSDKKASIVERFNRTLKGTMFKRFSHRGSYIWYDILPSLIKSYNNKYHRTIGMKPIEVNKSNERLVLSRILKHTAPRTESKQPKIFSLGDKVRISKFKGIFSKRYLPNWTNEVFTIYRVQPTKPETYILKDNKGELLQGSFYGHELLKTYVGDVYLVEKVLKKKGDKVLIKWLGFDKSQNSWIPKKDLL